MLVFIGSLRHPDVVNNYEKVKTLLHNTLLSLCNQSNDNFKILIVCNRRPHFQAPFYDDFVEYVEVDFPASVAFGRDKQERLLNGRIDKGTKYMVGIAVAQKLKPDYIMFFDTDDFVSSNIVQFVNASGKNQNGWYIDKGYIHYLDSGSFYEKNEFNQHCGTSLIIKNDLLTNPVSKGIVHISIPDAGSLAIDTHKTFFTASISSSSSQKDIIAAVDNNFLKYIIGSHRWAAAYYGLAPLPFRGAIWNINTGENYGGNRKIKGEQLININSIDIHEFIPNHIVSL